MFLIYKDSDKNALKEEIFVLLWEAGRNLWTHCRAGLWFAHLYCPPEGKARVWSFFRKHGSENMDKYIDFVRGDNPKNRMPLCVKAKKEANKKTVQKPPFYYL